MVVRSRLAQPALEPTSQSVSPRQHLQLYQSTLVFLISNMCFLLRILYIYIGFVCICQQSWQASFACNIHDIYIYIYIWNMHQIQQIEYCCQSMPIPGKCQGASRTIYRDWGVQKGIHQICTHSSWRTARVLLVWRCWSSRKIGWLLLHLQQETQCCSGHWCLLRWTLVQKHQLWEHKLSQVGQLLHWPWWVFWFNISLGCQERYRGDVSSSCVLREHKGGGRLCQGSPWC